MTTTFDPTSLTPDSIDSLDEYQLRVALSYFVEKDDLTANTPKRISEAMRGKVSCYDCGRGMSTCVRSIVNGKYGWRSVIPYDYECHGGRAVHRPDWVWLNRHDQNWQSDLEAHVSAWRAEPVILDNDYAVGLFEQGMPLRTNKAGTVRHVVQQLEDGAFRIQQQRYADRGAHTVPGWDNWWSVDGPEFRIAAAKAALKRCLNEEWERKPKEQS